MAQSIGLPKIMDRIKKPFYKIILNLENTKTISKTSIREVLLHEIHEIFIKKVKVEELEEEEFKLENFTSDLDYTKHLLKKFKQIRKNIKDKKSKKYKSYKPDMDDIKDIGEMLENLDGDFKSLIYIITNYPGYELNKHANEYVLDSKPDKKWSDTLNKVLNRPNPSPGGSNFRRKDKYYPHILRQYQIDKKISIESIEVLLKLDIKSEVELNEKREILGDKYKESISALYEERQFLQDDFPNLIKKLHEEHNFYFDKGTCVMTQAAQDDLGDVPPEIIKETTKLDFSDLYKYTLLGGTLSLNAIQNEFKSNKRYPNLNYSLTNFTNFTKKLKNIYGEEELTKYSEGVSGGDIEWQLNQEHLIKGTDQFINETREVQFRIWSKLLRKLTVNDKSDLKESAKRAEDKDPVIDNYIFIAPPINNITENEDKFLNIEKVLGEHDQLSRIEIWTDKDTTLIKLVIAQKIYFIDGQFYLVYSEVKEEKGNYILLAELKTVDVSSISSLKLIEKNITLYNRKNEITDLMVLNQKITGFLRKGLVSNRDIHDAYANYENDIYFNIFVLVPYKNTQGTKVAEFFYNTKYLRFQESASADEMQELDENTQNEYDMFKFKVMQLKDFQSVMNKWGDQIIIHKVVKHIDNSVENNQHIKLFTKYTEQFINFIAKNNQYREKNDILKKASGFMFHHINKKMKDIEKDLIEDAFISYLRKSKRMEKFMEKLNKK